jgi:hypothetical protein
MGKPEIASFDSIPLQGELIQPPPVPRKSAQGPDEFARNARGGRMVDDVSEILLRDLVRHHATASIPRRLKPQPLAIEAWAAARAPGMSQPSLHNSGETQQ